MILYINTSHITRPGDKHMLQKWTKDYRLFSCIKPFHLWKSSNWSTLYLATWRHSDEDRSILAWRAVPCRLAKGNEIVISPPCRHTRRSSLLECHTKTQYWPHSTDQDEDQAKRKWQALPYQLSNLVSIHSCLETGNTFPFAHYVARFGKKAHHPGRPKSNLYWTVVVCATQDELFVIGTLSVDNRRDRQIVCLLLVGLVTCETRFAKAQCHCFKWNFPKASDEFTAFE
jgi:hypothetical protein